MFQQDESSISYNFIWGFAESNIVWKWTAGANLTLLPRSLTLHHTVSPSRGTDSIRVNFHNCHPHCRNFLGG